MAPSDKILFLQGAETSKNWAMTGWRHRRWLEAPAALGPVIENLIQFTTSGVPVFAQRAATAALDQGQLYHRRARSNACMRRCRHYLRRLGGDRPRSVRPARRGVLSILRDRGRTRFARPCAALDRRGGRRRGAGLRLRSGRRRLSAPVLRAGHRRNRRGHPPARTLADALEGMDRGPSCERPPSL